MTNLSTEQQAFLAQITRARERLDRVVNKAETERHTLDALLKTGREMGISTHRLAQASRLSQPRVQQLTHPPRTSYE